MKRDRFPVKSNLFVCNKHAARQYDTIRKNLEIFDHLMWVNEDFSEGVGTTEQNITETENKCSLAQTLNRLYHIVPFKM